MKSSTKLFSIGILLSLLLPFFSASSDSTLSLNQKLNSFIQLYQSNYDLKEDVSIRSSLDKTDYSWTRGLMLKKKTSFINHYEQKVYQRLYIKGYEYKDAKSCQEAIDKLLTCFPNDCIKVKKGQDVKGLKIVPSLYILSDTQIIFCKINCEHENKDWKTIQENFIKTFASSNSDIITTGCGGPLKWSAK